MPTYRNDADVQSYRVRHISGEKRTVLPGQSIETYQDLSNNSDMTQTATTPIYNNVLALTQPTGSGDATITLNADTKKVEIYNVSSYTTNAYLDAKTNTPARIVPSGAVETIDNIKGKINTLILSFGGSISAGQVNVTEFKE